jgi:hypothetical protein
MNANHNLPMDDRPSIFFPATDATCALPSRRPASNGRRTQNKRKQRRNMTYRRRR